MECFFFLREDEIQKKAACAIIEWGFGEFFS